MSGDGPDLTAIAKALQEFGGNPQHAGPLAALLGFSPVSTPADLLAGPATPLSRFFDARSDRFGVRELYRVGRLGSGGATAGMYVAVLDDWGVRSTDRDRPRRRVARALVELTKDARALFVMVPHGGASPRDRRQAEFVLPRSTTEIAAKRGGGGLTTVRALVDLTNPSRFHRELLRDLAVHPHSTLAEVAQRWHVAFSIERVTKQFYQQYAAVRDRLADALHAANRDHPVVKQLSDSETRAWATRQLGRILFLWFLQAKRWLGEPAGDGSPTFLLDLWGRRHEAQGGFYEGILVPLFFEAMAKRHPSQRVRDLFGFTPYLNGGLFRRDALEDRIEEGGPITIPDDVFDPAGGERTILGLLSRYRFTTRESTPDDQSVDPDPELLGRVFENLYQGDERHDTGTYYTPREIVHFMCRQVIDGYLRDAGVDQDTIDRLRRVAVERDGTDEWRPDQETERRITEALESVRICDPAVGSGAFLLGAMHEIVQLRRGLLLARGEYHANEQELVARWKRHAIQWSLYGVDINPEAVEICQLRLWLSLVLDSVDPTTVDPLPNLDFRIVAGDSLVDRVNGVVFAESIGGTAQHTMKTPEIEALDRKIRQWRQEFEAADDPARLRELRKRVAEGHRELVRVQVEAALDEARKHLREVEANPSPDRKKQASAVRGAHERVEALERALQAASAAAPYEKPFLWPVAFPEVFQDGGFDIVLANPPYVRQEKLDPADQEVWKEAFPEVYAGTADILVYFYARAVQILRPGGWLSFITSNKYMRAAYGQGIRGHLSSALALERAIDLGDLPLFEANGRPVAAYPAVLVGRKDRAREEHQLAVADLTYPVRRALADAGKRVTPEAVREVLEDLDALLKATEHADYPQVLLRPEARRQGWILEDPRLVRLFERLMAQGTPLGQYVGGRMYYGIKTGLNEAFVIDQAKRDELVAADPRSAELIKPWLRGKDIKRWRPEWAGLYVIAIQNSGDRDARNPWGNARNEAEARRIFSETYPALHAHLSAYEGRLRPRADQGRWWWELRACAYYHEFERPKIVWPDISRTLRFAWDESGAFADTTCFMIPGGPSWLAGLLNSTVGEFLLCLLTSALRGGFMRLKIAYIEPFPVPQVKDGLQAEIGRLVEERRPDVEARLEELVAAAYHLRPGDLELIDEWFERRSLTPGADQGDGVGSEGD